MHRIPSILEVKFQRDRSSALDIGRISPTSTPRIRLRVKDQVELEPRSMSLVTAEQDQADGLILLEGKTGTEHRVLCEVRNIEVTLSIINANSKKMKLAKGRVVARGVMVEDENFFKLKKKKELVGQLTAVDDVNELSEKDVVTGEGLPVVIRSKLVEVPTAAAQEGIRVNDVTSGKDRSDRL